MNGRPDADAARLALSGRRVLITRATGQASELGERLRGLGATAILIPAIEIGPPASYAALDAALGTLDVFDLVAFTSANAVEAFRQRAHLLGFAPGPREPTPTPRRIAVVGPATARAVAAVGLHADVVPPVFTAESLAEVLLPEARGQRILLVLAEQATATLYSALKAAGACVTVAAAYANRVPRGSPAAIAALFADPANYPDAVTFTSASTAVNLVALLESAGLKLPSTVVRASIGPVTTRALRKLGLPPHVQAAEPSIAALADALAAHFRGNCNLVDSILPR